MGHAIRSIHFVGIGGTAMAAAAAAAQERGYRVTGSDQGIYPPMSTFLAERGIPVRSPYAEANLGERPDLVVIGNALSRGNPEVERVLDAGWRYCSLPEFLREYFIRGKRCLVVAGTHGKTTTTTLLAWTFVCAGLDPSFLIGGIGRNLGEGARFTESEWFIIEGDEYDSAFFDKRSKFLHYLPEVAVINNLEFDHADIFENLGAVQTTFRRLMQLVPRRGLVLANGDDAALAPVIQNPPCPVRRFGLGVENDFRAVAIELEPVASRFEVDGRCFRLPLTGELNIRNALAVLACAQHCGVSLDVVQQAFSSFTGIQRRMEVRGEAGGVTVVDDFGHHPTAIRETLRALRIRFPARRLWAVFEPRSNTTRRNVFQEDLAQALSLADAVVVAEVARLALLAVHERLDPDRLIRSLRSGGRPADYIVEVDAIVDHLSRQARPGDVIAVFSNGGFGGIHAKLLERLTERTNRSASAIC